MNEKEIRSVLGQFLFSGDDVLKLVNTLSGGGKSTPCLSKTHVAKSKFPRIRRTNEPS